MKKLKIVKKNNFVYELEDDKKMVYSINLQFMDIEEEPENGDYICISNKLLNPRYDGYSTSYTFGNLENKYGKNNISLTDIDVIKVLLKDKEVYLKRLYG